MDLELTNQIASVSLANKNIDRVKEFGALCKYQLYNKRNKTVDASENH